MNLTDLQPCVSSYILIHNMTNKILNSWKNATLAWIQLTTDGCDMTIVYKSSAGIDNYYFLLSQYNNIDLSWLSL